MSSVDRAVERVETALSGIEATEPTLRATISVMADEARAVARDVDTAAPLGGRVVAVKDNIDVRGVRATSGSPFLADHVPDSDATTVARIRAAGGILIAKTNLSELALGATTQNPHYGGCRNPWDPTRIPAGSSGGSAVAVACGWADLALATDTGGSIRGPAAVTGIVGIRPTRGRLPYAGAHPCSPTFDTIGPMARTVADAALLFDVMDGFDPGDPTCDDRPRDSVRTTIDHGLAGMRIGVPTDPFFAPDPSLAPAVDRALSDLEAAGAAVVPLSLPGSERTQEHLLNILNADAAAMHRDRVAAAPERFGEDVLRRLRLGAATPVVDYASSSAWRARWRHTLREAFRCVDVIASVSAPVPPPVADSAEMIETTRRVNRLFGAWALAGLPAMSVPCGFDERALPVGLQLAAPPYHEHVLIQVGHAYQRCTEHHRRRPPITVAPPRSWSEAPVDADD